MINLTPAATQEVKRLIEKEQKPNLGLRMGIKGGGCSGMTYVLALEEAVARGRPKVGFVARGERGINALAHVLHHERRGPVAPSDARRAAVPREA
mgnify:CR=1 FL=1